MKQEIDPRIGKIAAVYAIAIGIVWVAMSCINVSGSMGVQPDIFGGYASIVTGVVFLFGVRKLWRARYEGLSFLLVGLLLSTLFGILYLLILGANGLDHWLVGENPMWIQDLRPEIWLWLISLPSLYFIRNVRETKKNL